MAWVVLFLFLALANIVAGAFYPDHKVLTMVSAWGCIVCASIAVLEMKLKQYQHDMLTNLIEMAKQERELTAVMQAFVKSFAETNKQDTKILESLSRYLKGGADSV